MATITGWRKENAKTSMRERRKRPLCVLSLATICFPWAYFLWPSSLCDHCG
ncbi:DUF943 domain-containing protein [Sesbania bispinosa]|nr:DUF943 domain-containing protein [Sesbania bispinosa]